MLTPFERYQTFIKSNQLYPDPVQEQAVFYTQTLYQQLINTPRYRTHWLNKLLKRPIPLVPGLYLYGAIGRGKSWVVDNFYYCLPFKDKQRLHYHDFMLKVHENLALLPKTPDPLRIIGHWFSSMHKLTQ